MSIVAGDIDFFLEGTDEEEVLHFGFVVSGLQSMDVDDLLLLVCVLPPTKAGGGYGIKNNE